ncbi:MAG TPA: response regulator transcription factor [Candidatus Sulfotelmatobacter sp.]|nr:response regulator transcription factor [Candidatus Sulfotelmatobacter sp.]
MLEDESDFEVAGEAGDAAECLRKIFESRPDVVIAEMNTFGLSASEAELLVARECPHTKLVLLNEQEQAGSAFDDPKTVLECPAARQTSVEQLVKMVRSICHREDPEPHLADELRHGPESAPPQESALTTRERQVLKLLAEGKTVRGAATDLGVSSKTVDAHKFNLMRKLGIHNKAELVMWAIQKRVVKVPA